MKPAVQGRRFSPRAQRMRESADDYSEVGWNTRSGRSRRHAGDAAAFSGARYRTTLGIRLDGQTGNLPSSGLEPDQLR